MDFDPTQYPEADRREVDPPIQVEVAAWSAGGHSRLVGERAPGGDGPSTRSWRSSTVGQSCWSSAHRERA